MSRAATIAALAARLASAGLRPPGGSTAAGAGAGVSGAAGLAAVEAAATLAARIDHTLLAPAATAADVERLCAEANRHGLHAVCVNPLHVRLAAAAVRPPVAVCSVADFPLGACVTEVRALQAARAVADGATEVDVVLQLGRLCQALPPQATGDGPGGRGDAIDDRELRAVQDDLVAVIAAARDAAARAGAPGCVVKVILETGLLDERRTIAGALLAAGAGADFVKTSTGVAVPGATVDDVLLLREVLGSRCRIKASGGIRTRAAALALLAAGADRLGCSASLAIIAAG